MFFNKPIANIEFYMLLFFGVFYLFFIGKMVWVAYQLKSSIKYLIFKFILRTFYFGLIILSSLGPGFGEIKEEIEIKQKNILLAVDISKSMLCTDIAPNRISKTKLSLKKLNDLIGNEHVGLCVFSQNAYLVSPFTVDKSAINTYIETLSPNYLVDNYGSNPETVIQLGINQLNYKAKNEANILLIVTDGENVNNITDEYIKKIKNSNIIVIFLGIGTEKGAPIPANIGHYLLQNGKIAHSYLHKNELKNLAEQLNGKYYQINDIFNETETLANYINNLEGISVGKIAIDTKSNKYFYFLILALILVCFDVLIPVKSIKI